MGALRGSAGDDSWMLLDQMLWGSPGINPAAGQKPRLAKKPVRIAQALQKVIRFNLVIYLCVCLFLSTSF